MAINVKTDIFPAVLSNRVRKLRDYPHFGSLMGEREVLHYCLYLEGHRIYFQKRNMSDAAINGIVHNGKDSKLFNEFRPDDVDWVKVRNKFKKPAVESNRKNADIRTGYVMGSDYLVKAHFTFGMRRVEPGTAHVIQTLNVPLLLYRLPRLFFDRVKYYKGRFPYESIVKFDRYVLKPRTCSRIPPGTVYFLFAVQKTYFRFDVVRADVQIPFPHSDPLETRVKKIDGMYSRPVPTPFIGDVERARFEESRNAAESESRNAVPSDGNAEPSDGNAVPSDGNAVPSDTPDDLVAHFGDLMQFQPQTFYLMPLERNVVTAEQDFVRAYGYLKSKEFGDPREFVPAEGGVCEGVLDLSPERIPEPEKGTRDAEMEEMDFQNALGELCSQYL